MIHLSNSFATPGVILPVTLIDFSGARTADGIELFWTTAREVSLASYQPERSADGKSFYTVGVVPAVNASTVKTYNWTDHNPGPGVNYYRLKMIDIDGKFKYSRVLGFDMNKSLPKGAYYLQIADPGMNIKICKVIIP